MMTEILVFEKLKKDLSTLWGKHSGSIRFRLFLSALTDYSPAHDTQGIRDWLQELNSKQFFEVQPIAFNQMQQWKFDLDTGDIRHKSGKFFSIRGMEIRESKSGHKLWDQPVIDQPEVGILGILCKEIDGVLCLLMQAKAEPGNINTYQLSPTVQATRSNYLQVHGGRKTQYIEFFNGETVVEVVLDQYQSEQGARFLAKRNRNIMVLADQDSEPNLSENHRWISLGQLKSLMEYDNTVNMDSRSIISLIDYKIQGFAPDYKKLKQIIDEHRAIISRSDFWIKSVGDYICSEPESLSMVRNAVTWSRYFCSLEKKLVNLNSLSDWTITDKLIEHKGNKYFQVMAVKITANNREVDTWDQPIVKQRHHGKIALICNDDESGIRFLIQMKLEPGLYDMIEFAPTVQCISENFVPGSAPKYLDYISNATQVYAAYQSEEGGRFFQECSLNQICVVGQENKENSHGFIYMKLSHLKQLVQFQQLLNVELRSLLAYF